MKHISVPAQVTTVEDRVVGNLTLTQLILLASPMFINFGLYAILPKAMHINLYKLLLMLVIAFTFFSLATRFRGRIVLEWAITLARFRFRSKLYIFSKKSLYLRSTLQPENNEIDKPIVSTNTRHEPKPVLEEPVTDIRLNTLNLNLNFIEERKGKLYVYVNK